MLNYLNAKFATAIAQTNKHAKQQEKTSNNSKVKQEDKLRERIAFAFQ